MLNIKDFLGLSYYTSHLDEFLAYFNTSNTKLSPSQRKEIEKYRRIYNLRDKPQQASSSKQDLWEQF